MRLLLLFIFLLLQTALADEVKIEISPKKPVAGQVFQAVFHIFTEADEEPTINFSPYRVEVVGKNNQGISTSSIYSNGHLVTTREMIVVYDLAAGTVGMGGLRDITVQVGNKVLRHPSLNFNIVNEPEVAADVFVMADVPKKSVFLGEGFVVRYYLYHKAPVNNLDVKKYPKLNNFLKRFLQEPDRSERVSVDGQLYVRNQIYSAKLFPEKVGELKIDPLHLSATVMVSRDNDPFGAFGFGREMRTKNISSESVSVQVKPLPEEGKPANFTGLIGKHDFDLQIPNPRLIVNEPLEVKLTISGGGALENLEAPEIFKNAGLEEFESNGDLKIMDADQATKVFDYTFLAKNSLQIPASNLTLSYFDPDSMRYVPVQLKLPEIVVAGSGVTRSSEGPKVEEAKAQESPIKRLEMPKDIAAPIFQEAKSWKNWLQYLNLILGIGALILAVSLIAKKDKLPNFSANTIPSAFKKGDFSLGEFTRWLTPIILKTGKSPLSVIRDSELSEETKKYFVELLNSNDQKSYSTVKGQFKFSYRSEFFKELDKYIQQVNNENPTQST